MFDLEDDDASRREKCYTTIAQLPRFIDPKQPPTKTSPFSSILGHSFVHTVEVTIPKEVYSSIKSSLNSTLPKLQYARVSMSLSSIIERDFFNTYIKSGNILMISEGRFGSDNVCTLRDGVLGLELGKEDFERTGLTGKPVRSGGKKHAKERYLVEVNLRQPSMLHGKKGFQRIEWAFKTVLTKSFSWLFFDLATESRGVSEDDPTLKGNNPTIIASELALTSHSNIFTPSFDRLPISAKMPETELREQCQDISEWLAMVSLDSGRVSANDDIDPYLCRYDVPDIGDVQSQDIIKLKWHGLIPSKWIRQLFITLFRETAARKCQTPSWFALSSSALGRSAVEGRDGYTIMVLPTGSYSDIQDSAEGGKVSTEETDNRSFICWDYVGASVL